MPYSLVPIIDVGRSPYLSGNRQRRMPLGLDQGGHSVHLGPDQALLWSPADVVDVRVTKLAESVEEPLATASRTAINDLRLDGRTPPTRTGDALADLLVAPPRTLWKPLVATRSGYLEVRLGPSPDNVIWNRRVIRGGVDIQDDFNRTSNLAGSTTSDAQTTWAEDQGTGWTVDGDEAEIENNVGFCVARLVLGMDTADHYAEADLTRFAWFSATLSMGITVRANATPTSGYAFEVANSGGSNARRVYNFATDATIDSDTTAPAAAMLYLEMDGSTYTAKVAGSTVFTGTDTAHDGTVKGVGLQAYCDNATPAQTAGFTSFRGADLAGVPVALVRINYFRLPKPRLVAPADVRF